MCKIYNGKSEKCKDNYIGETVQNAVTCWKIIILVTCQNWVNTLEKILILYSALQIRTCQQSITANPWPLTDHICHVIIIVTLAFPRSL